MFNPINSDRNPLRARRAGVASVLMLAALFALALPEDREQPIEIQADEGSFDPDRGVSVLAGSVLLNQGTLRVSASRVTISNRGGQLDRIVAEGEADAPATFRQRLSVGEPFVNAHARRIDYAIAEQRIELKGGAFLSQDDREFSGEEIFWNIEEGRVDARSGQPGGVRLKWQPEPAAND